MDLACIFLAEAAVAQEGKFFVHGGGMHYLRTAGFPTIIPSLSVLALIRLQPDECRTSHAFSLSGTGPDGIVFLPSTIGGLIGELIKERPDLPVNATIIVNFRGVVITKPGKHEFCLEVDGRELGRVSFVVDEAPAQQSAQRTQTRGE
jgi:Family of unknown function (DUF6941)